jgi:hypothetical protein
MDSVKFVHPNYPGVSMGEVLIEFWMLPVNEADLSPVGEAQYEPNRDPYLAPPSRNPPRWAVGTRGLNALDRYKYIALAIIVVIILIVVIVGVVIATK